MDGQHSNKKVDYRFFTSKSETHKAFNSLVGIIEGISLDYKVSQLERDELEQWCVKHDFLAQRNPFKDLIEQMAMIMEDNIITDEELEDMLWVCEKFKNDFNYYDELSSDLQQLQGLIHGLLSDGELNDKEIISLNSWLVHNKHLETYYPYDQITLMIKEILEDGVIDEEERATLMKFLNEFVQLNNPEVQDIIDKKTSKSEEVSIFTIDPIITIQDNQFCFTGESTNYSRDEIVEGIKSKGGRYVNSVSGKTNYLIVGSEANPCWAYASYGRKVEKAINYIRKGKQIAIVKEVDFWKVVGG